MNQGGTKNNERWGWGWIILIGLISYTINKTYSGFDLNTILLYLIGISSSLLFYFYFRNIRFGKINYPKFKSFLSGSITFVVCILIISESQVFLNIINPNIKNDVARIIVEEMKKSKSSIDEMNDYESTIFEMYNADPETDKEIKQNIEIL